MLNRMPTRPPQQTASRRAFLRGAGAALALPWLASFGAARRAERARPPVRLGFFFMPNGVLPSAWQVQGEGEAFELSPTLAPLAPWKDRLTVLDRALVKPLKRYLDEVRQKFDEDALHEPGLRWGEYYVFPSEKLKVDPRSRVVKRVHLDRNRFARALAVVTIFSL